MSTEIASFYATISARTEGLQKGLGQAHDAMEGLKASTIAMGVVVGNLVTGAVNQLANMASSVVTTGIQFDDLKEKSQIAFTTMLGSGEKAQSFLNDLQSFAAKTPFEFPDLIQASQRLMAMGIQAEKVIPTMTAIGDAVAAMGGDAGTINRVTLAIGQMNAKGKTQAGEMMQLTEAGIPAWQMLADKIGKSVPDAMDLVSKGAIDARTTITAVTEGMEAKFGGMMDKQSHTWSGLLSNVQDFFTQASGKVMKPFFDMAEKHLSTLVDWMSTADFSAWVDKAASAVGALATAFDDVFSMLANGEDILSALLTFIGDLMPENLLPAWTAFATGFYDVAQSIGSALQYIATFFASTFTILTNGNLSWGQKLIAIWDMIYVTGQRIWTSLAASLSSLIPQWLDNLGEWAQAIWQWIVKSIPIALAKLGEWAAGLWGWIADNLPTWISNLGTWAVALWKWIVDVTPVVVAKLMELGQWIVGAVLIWSPMLGSVVSGIWTIIVDIFTAGYALVTGDWAKFWQYIQNIYLDFMDQIWPVLVTLGQMLWQWIVDNTPIALAKLQEWGAALWGWISTNAPTWAATLGQWAAAAWNWIATVTPLALAELGKWAAALWNWLSTNAPTWSAKLQAWGTALWNWIVTATPVALAKLQEWAGQLNAWLVANVPLLATLEQWGIGLWQWLADAFGPFVSWLTQFATQFISWKDVVVGAIVALGVVFAPVIVGAFGVIIGAIGSFIAAWAPVIALFAAAILAVAALRNAWENDWGGIRTNTEAALQFLATAFAPLMSAIQQFGSESLKEIVAWATGQKTNFDATQKIWEAAKTSFTTVFSAISTKLQEWAKIAWEWFQTNFPHAADTANAAVDSIKSHWNVFVEAAHPLIVKIQDAWNRLVDDWKSGGGGVNDAMTRLKNVLDNVWAIMLDTMRFSINTILNLMTLVVQLINGDWTGAWKTAQNIAHDAWNFIVGVTTHAVDAIAGLFGSNAQEVYAWINGIVDKARNSWNDFWNAGRDIIQGLWQGIQSAWRDYIAGPVVALINSLPTAVKVALGIHSPSTVFADIGSDMMLGLAKGIDGSQQFVVDAMGNIVESTKKYTEWDKLGEALGTKQADALVKNIKVVGLNALSDIKKAGIGSDSNVFAWATQLTQSTSSDTIGNVLNNLNNVIQQFDQLGLSNSYGKGTRETLGSLSGTIGDFLDTGTYYAPYVSGSGSNTTVGGTTADTNKFMQAISVALNKILAELQKDGKMEEAGLNKIVVAINNLDSGLGGKVAVTTGLR